MSNKPYTSHRAIISLSFDVHNGCDPNEVANEIVKDMIGDGYRANLDEIVDIDGGESDNLESKFICPALEAGHGDTFMAAFVITKDPDCPEVFVFESCDLLVENGKESEWTPIGAVGGEIEVMAVRRADGSLDIEQMSRNWLGIWHRHFVGATEDSVHGLFLMIKQTISEGTFIK